MRKTKLFTLVALSALMAACSQDDFVTPAGDAKVDLGNRPALGYVTIDLGDANTRMAFNGSFNWKWEDGDEVGAAIVDAPDMTNPKDGYIGSEKATWTYAEYVQGAKKLIGSKEYSFTQTTDKAITDPAAKLHTAKDWYSLNGDNHISSNYPYVIEDNKFSSQANLVEGNYLFYAPYDGRHLTREPLVVVTPMIQDCSEKEMKSTNYLKKPAQVSSKSLSDFYKGTTKGFEKAVVAVGYNFLAAPADRTQPIEATAPMKDVFAYPMFTIVNNYNGFLFDGTEVSTSTAQKPAIVLDSIQIYTIEADKILYKNAIGAQAAKDALTGDAWTAAGKYTNDASNTASLFAANSPYATPTYFAATDGRANTKLTFVGSTNTIAYQQQHITCDLGGKVLNQGDDYHFHAIMPAENYGKLLYAKIFVKIGDKRYVIYNAGEGALTVDNATASATYGKATADLSKDYSDWNFRDMKNGDQEARLIRGEHYPAPELLEGGVGTKNFAGTMLTINLTGGTAQAAFALTEASGDYGFTNNEEMIEYMTKELQRGVNMVESAAMQNTPRDDWKGENGTTAGHFAFAAKNTCIINAELIKALKDKMFQNTNNGSTIKLDTNLPIAGDVTIKEIGTPDNENYISYTIETLDKEASYTVKLKEVASTDGTALVDGINNIATGVATLAVKNGTKNAVVIVDGANVTLSKADGISAIYVKNGSMTVNTSCKSLFVLDGGSVTIGQNGSLTNANNDLKNGNISNANLKEIAGTIANAVTVTASSENFPTKAIAKNTRINSFTITKSGVITIEQAQIDMFANLSDVNITLSNATEIKSTNNVTLNNIKTLTAGSTISWEKTAGEVVVTYFGENVIIDISQGTDVTFVKGATGANE